MKKISSALILASTLALNGVAHSADTTAQAVATWSATAKKDSSSKLVVTPIGSLNFDYAAGVNAFNTQKGMFDVTIEGDASATAFTLSSKLVTNTLLKLDSSGSTLSVGVTYNGEALNKTTDTTMVDTSAGILGGNLSALSTAYNQADRSSAQDQFTFSIVEATSDGTTPVADLKSLTDGVWIGDVSVEFNATWTA